MLFEIQLNSLRITICRFYLTKNNTVGSWFLDRAQYNKFVESGSKSWALIRRWLVLGVKNTQNRVAQRPREKGPLARGQESPTPLGHTGASFLSLGLPILLGRLPPSPLGDLCCYIFLSFVHPHPTLVSHPCLSLSARPIGHSFWRSVSCCGPYRPVQGSHPHQWGQGVSCGYLIQRWLLLLGLSLHHSPMASPYGLESLFAILEWIASGDITLFSSMILACRG